jgi:pimeloyl-ACP methyl ester carboxylesterase
MLEYARFTARRYQRRIRLRYPKPIGDTDVSFSLDMESDARTLLLAFGGLNRQIGMPPFEFFSLTRDIPVKRLFVRDPRQAWYHCGMPQHGASLMSVADSLRGLIARHDVERLVVVGNSAGGYAALVFGTLLGAETVLCFAPQTVLDLKVLAAAGDHRWDDNLRPHARTGALDPHWIDLQRALPGARRADTRYEIYFDDSSLLERWHAERLLGIEGVRLYRFGHGDHDLVRMLRETGALERILRRALHAPGETLASETASQA